MTKAGFTYDLGESFPKLDRPPIVEAVIHWRARSLRPFEPESLQAALKDRMPSYPKFSLIHEEHWLTTVASKDDVEIQGQRSKYFTGYRLSSEDGRYVVQFRQDGLIFSRTRPYDHWEPFVAAAKEAWKAFLNIAAPMEINRLGVRFINQIAGATADSLRDVLRDPPSCPANLSLKEFVYQSTFNVPEYPFRVRVIKVLQPPSPELKSNTGLFLDVDVCSLEEIPIDTATLDVRMDKDLSLMRSLKNKVFFNLITEQAVRSFQEKG